ncbi:MAG: ankyrin repeat domain-containing protein [Candidatus Krumholzibacteriia bacterium]
MKIKDSTIFTLAMFATFLLWPLLANGGNRSKIVGVIQHLEGGSFNRPDGKTVNIVDRIDEIGKGFLVQSSEGIHFQTNALYEVSGIVESFSVSSGTCDSVWITVEKAVLLETFSPEDWKVIEFAGECKIAEMEAYLELGGNPRLKNYQGDSPLIALIDGYSSKRFEVDFDTILRGISVLIEKGCPVDDRNISGFTPLHFAAKWEELKPVVELLILHGADVNAISCLGKTPLHMACVFNSQDCAILLLNHGAKIDIKDNVGKTPVDYASDSLKLVLKGLARSDLR